MLEKHIVELTARDNLSPALRKAGQAAEDAGNKGKRSAQDWGRALTAVGAAAGGAVGVMAKLGQAHMDEERQIRAIERAYGDSSAEILDFTQKIQDMGIASDDAARIAALGAQSLAKNYGFTADQINELISRSADLSATTFDQFGNQLGLADVMQRVAGAMRGEAESAEILGVAMSDSALASLAAQEGLTGWNTTMTESEKAAFRFKVFMDQTTDAQGAAAEQANTTAGKMRALQIQIGDVASEAGGALGPLGEMTSVLGDVALAAPLAGAGLGKLAAASSSLMGVGGVAALGSALATVGVVTASLAAPIGIATYLFIDQKRVMKEATEETLKNQDALEGYINYLNGLDLPTEQIETMSQDMKELVDWVTKVGDTIDTGLIQTAPGLKAFSTNVGELDDTIRGLNPESLEAVLTLADQLGIVFTDPSTWDPANINVLSNYIVTLSQAEADAEYTALEMNRAHGGLNTVLSETAAITPKVTDAVRFSTHEWHAAVPAITATTDALDDNTAALDKNTQATGDWYSMYHSAAPVIETTVSEVGLLGQALIRVGDAGPIAGRGLGDTAVGAQGATTASAALESQINALAVTLQDMPADVLDRTFGIIVGNTNSMAGSVKTAKDWADALIAPVGTYSELDNLLASGAISLDEYNQAQQAQIAITNDAARAQTAANTIQAVNAEVIADQTDAVADYMEHIAGLPQAEQLVQLAWADTDISGRANEIAGMAADFDDMSAAQQGAFEQMVTSAAATDPALAAVLESLGLIKADVNDPTGWSLSMGTSDAESDIDRLNATMGDFIKLFDPTYVANTDINDMGAVARAGIALELFTLDNTTATPDVDADTSLFWQAVNGIDGHYVGTAYVNVIADSGAGIGAQVGFGALGGVVPLSGGIDTAALGRVSGGNLTMVGEHGPELVNLPGGSLVTPHHATAYRPESRRGGDFVFTGDFHFHGVQNPDQFMRQMRDYVSSMARS